MLEEYMELAHAMQSGVAYEMEIDPDFKDLPENLKKIFKHLRVGINTALVESGALQGILIDNMAIPAVVFTDPELAWCGETETEAKAEKRKVNVFRFPWAASGRAQTLARTEGLTKLSCDPDTQRVLGMGIVGHGAGEMIGEDVLAVPLGTTAQDLAETIHAHPTLSETIMEAAEGIVGQATHIYRPPRKKR